MSSLVAAADDSAAHDAYELELEAASAHFGADAAGLEHLLSNVLAHEVARHQVQPLLERAWVRLQTLRERIGELRPRFSAPDVTQLIEQTDEDLGSGKPLSLAAVETALERASRICLENGVPNIDTARIQGARALTAALSLDFRRAAALSAEAAQLAQSDEEQSLRYRFEQAEYLHDQGREFRDIEALQAVERLSVDSMLPMAPAPQRPDERARIYDGLGSALGILGRQHRGTHILEQAIEAFEGALSLWGRERKPLEWAATQNSLGNAIGLLGQRQHDEELLARSAAAFEAALEVQTPDAESEAWASTHSNLAAVLQSLGMARKDSKLLKRAVDSYKAALTVWTRERKPIVWAATMRNLGSALRLLGGMRKGARTLGQSVAAYNAALSVQTREQMPADWAMTQNDLGAALQALGERTEDPVTLGRAIAAYREALKEITREDAPMTWAMSIANLGVARRKYAEHNEDIDIARQSTIDIKMAVDMFRGASHAQLTELGEEQLSLARKLVASLESTATQ